MSTRIQLIHTINLSNAARNYRETFYVILSVIYISPRGCDICSPYVASANAHEYIRYLNYPITYLYYLYHLFVHFSLLDINKQCRKQFLKTISLLNQKVFLRYTNRRLWMQLSSEIFTCSRPSSRDGSNIREIAAALKMPFPLSIAHCSSFS